MNSNSVGRPVLGEVEARECFAAMNTQNLCIWAFARATGVCPKSLYRWRKLLNVSTPIDPRRRKTLADVPHSSSLPWVELVPAAPISPPAVSAPVRYELVVGTVVVRVGDDFRDDTLARLLRVAAAC